MTTRKKLHKMRQLAREEDVVVVDDPTRSPQWRSHSREMAAMLRGIDPDRFERLADG